MAAVKTGEHLRLWLESQPQEVGVAFATRAALRVFPFVTNYNRYITAEHTQALLTARCILTSGVAVKLPSLEVSVAARASAAVAAPHASVTGANAAIAAPHASGSGASAGIAAPPDVSAAFHATRAAYIAALTVSGTANSVRSAAADAVESAANSVEAAANTDGATGEAATAAAYPDTELALQDLLSAPLWDNLKVPGWLIDLLKPDRNILDSGPEWAFWRRWYHGYLVGEPLDWELQRRVALIDNAIWEAGPEAVAKEIEKIEATYKVEVLARNLEESAYVAQTHAPGIGDNNPPSLIGDDLEDQPPVTIIWVASRELREQAQSSRPNTDLVKRAVGALTGVLKSMGLWVAGVLGEGIRATVVSTGKAAGPAILAWVTLNTNKVQELIDAAQQWLRLIQ